MKNDSTLYWSVKDNLLHNTTCYKFLKPVTKSRFIGFDYVWEQNKIQSTVQISSTISKCWVKFLVLSHCWCSVEIAWLVMLAQKWA